MRDVIRKSEFALLKKKRSMKTQRELEKLIRKVTGRLINDTKEWTYTEVHLILDFVEAIDAPSARCMLASICEHSTVNRFKFDSSVTPRAWDIAVKILKTLNPDKPIPPKGKRCLC